MWILYRLICILCVLLARQLIHCPEISGQESFSAQMADSLYNSGIEYHNIPDYDNAIDCYLKVFNIADSLNLTHLRETVSYQLACAYNEKTASMQYEEAIDNYKIALTYIAESDQNDSTILATRKIIEYNMASTYADKAADEAEISGNYAAAIQLTETAVSLYGDIYGTDNIEYANGFNLLAIYCYNNGEYSKALEYEKKSAEITRWVSGEGSPAYAGSMYNLGLFTSYTGKFREAIRYMEKAAELYMDLYGMRSVEYAMALEDLSDMNVNLGLYDKAIEYMTEAIGILESLDSDMAKSHHVYGLKRLASLHGIFDDYSDALDVIAVAGDIQKTTCGINNSMYVGILRDMAYYNMALGHTAAATNALEEALGISAAISGASSAEYAEILGELASVRFAVGQYEDSWKMIIASIGSLQQLIEKPDSINQEGKVYIANIYLNLVNLILINQYDVGIFDENLENCALELINSEFVINPASKCALLNTLSAICSEKQDYEKAIEYLQRELEIKEKVWGKENLDYANTLNRLAIVYGKSEDIGKAIAIENEAIRIANLVYSEPHRYHIWHWTNLAGMYEITGDVSKMTMCVQAATEESTALIRKSFDMMTAGERKSFYAEYSFWFENSVHWYTYNYESDSLRANGYDCALLSKGLLLNSEAEFSRLMHESSDEEIIIMYDEWRALRMEADRLRENVDIEDRKIADSLDAEAYGMERRLMQKSKAFGDYIANLVIKWRDIQAKLADDEAAVEFVKFNTGKDSIMYAAYVIRKDMEIPEMIPLFEENELFTKDKYDWYTTSFISNLVWKPLENILHGIRTIFFSPAGELYNIAIENLPDTDGEGFLSDSRKHYRLSSTRELALTRINGDKGKAVVYGGLDYDMTEEELVNGTKGYHAKHCVDRAIADSLKRSIYSAGLPQYLPATMAEAEKIAGLLERASIPVELYISGFGVEASFKALSGKGIGMMHIATHGFYWNGHENYSQTEQLAHSSSIFARDMEYKAMTQSGLLFSGASLALAGHSLPDKMDNGILTAQEISSLDFRGLDLVVLSACQTGLGQVSGDGVFGLQRGFKKAGANTLLMSLWEVDDKATQILMEQFYSNLISGMDKYKALHEAQEYLREYEITTTEDNRDFMERRRDEEAGIEYIPEQVTFRPYESPQYWAAFIIMDAVY